MQEDWEEKHNKDDKLLLVVFIIIFLIAGVLIKIFHQQISPPNKNEKKLLTIKDF